MDHPPGSVPTQRRTTLVAFLALLIAVMVINVLMVWPYVSSPARKLAKISG